ncbi:hypothetical protein, partial [Photorhabdus aegyptia]
RRLNVEEPFGQGNSVVNLSLIKLNTKWNPALGVKTGGENGGEASFHGRIDGVWVYQHVIYDLVFN